jgi:hypothetical protein
MVFTKWPVFFSKTGISTSRRPVSWVLVVVARMIFFSVGGAEKPGITQNPKKTNANASVQVIRFIIMLLQIKTVFV